jgi:PAS domain S-box-containing protein
MNLSKKVTFSAFAIGLLTSIIIWLFLRFDLSEVFLIALVPLITMVAGYLIGRKITRPILSVCRSVDIMRSGNLEYQVEVKTKDEIGRLSKSVNQLAQDLIKSSTDINDMTEKIEERRKIEYGLREWGEHFWNLFEHADSAVFIHTFDGEIRNVNNRACEILGYTKGELMAMPFFQLYAEGELAHSKAASKTGKETQSLVFESKFKKKNHSTIFVEIHSTVADMKKGIMQSLVNDITQRKEMEEALQESEKKFRTFMETASDLMFITDKQGEFTYVNESLQKTLGYSRQEIIGKSMADVIEHGNKEDFKIIYQYLIDNEDKPNDVIWMTKDNIQVHGEMKTSGLYDDNGEFLGVSGVFRDITERKKVEESQRLAQLGKLAADVAHEVKNQMTAIQGLTELSLFSDTPVEEIKENLQVILNQCNQVNSIVGRLLKFSKPSPNIYREVNIHETLDMVVNLVGKKFMKDKIEIVKKYESSLPTVQVDDKQMQEVFLNLLQNASEAIDSDGEIEMTTKQNGKYIEIQIKDTGCGISEEVITQIFDPFFTTKKTGTGLGLSVCYGICKAHGGDLIYTSQPGEGTTATVVLPKFENLQA